MQRQHCLTNVGDIGNISPCAVRESCSSMRMGKWLIGFVKEEWRIDSSGIIEWTLWTLLVRHDLLSFVGFQVATVVNRRGSVGFYQLLLSFRANNRCSHSWSTLGCTRNTVIMFLEVKRRQKYLRGRIQWLVGIQNADIRYVEKAQEIDERKNNKQAASSRYGWWCCHERISNSLRVDQSPNVCIAMTMVGFSRCHKFRNCDPRSKFDLSVTNSSKKIPHSKWWRK